MLSMLRELSQSNIGPYKNTFEYQYFIQSVRSVYDNHSEVCQEAVGKKKSLLDSSNNKQELRPAYETIRTVYKKRTLKILE
jgi:hypothetical protein